MKIKITHLILLSTCLSMLSGCATTILYSDRHESISRLGIPTSPLVADLNVSVTRKIKGIGNFKDKSVNVAIERAKEIAMHDAVETNGADVIVDPNFQLTIKTGLYKKASVEAVVSGYYATYTNIHKADTTELKALKIYRDILNVSPADAPAHKIGLFSK